MGQLSSRWFLSNNFLSLVLLMLFTISISKIKNIFSPPFSFTFFQTNTIKYLFSVSFFGSFILVFRCLVPSDRKNKNLCLFVSFLLLEPDQNFFTTNKHCFLSFLSYSHTFSTFNSFHCFSTHLLSLDLFLDDGFVSAISSHSDACKLL